MVLDEGGLKLMEEILNEKNTNDTLSEIKKLAERVLSNVYSELNLGQKV